MKQGRSSVGPGSGFTVFPHDADVGLRGFGPSLEAAFAQVALALTAVVTDAPVAARTLIEVACDAPDRELLLVDWLNAIVFEMAVNGMLFGRFAVTIDGATDGTLRLTGQMWGEPVERSRHAPACEPKGATYTALAVTRRATGRWVAQCVVDV